MRRWFLIVACLVVTGAFSFTNVLRRSVSTTKRTAANEKAQLAEPATAVVSAAERIAKATTISELLDAEQYLIHPGEESMHYHHQLVHQRKRYTAVFVKSRF